jgi:hypothetical protein
MVCRRNAVERKPFPESSTSPPHSDIEDRHCNRSTSEKHGSIESVSVPNNLIMARVLGQSIPTSALARARGQDALSDDLLRIAH